MALLNIDRFKVLNGSLGQDIGDERLRQLGERLQQWAANGLNVPRLNGNKFALVGTLSSTHEASAQHEAHALIDQILDTLTADYSLQGHRRRLPT